MLDKDEGVEANMLEREVIDKFLAEKKEKGFIHHVGIGDIEYDEGYATGKLDIKPNLLNPFGSVHGGCIFTLADTIGGTAAMTRGSYVTTISSSIQFLNPAQNTAFLVAEANEVKDGKTISVYDVMIRDDKQRDIAKVTLNYYKLQPVQL